MENTISVSVNSFQVLLAFAFQIWIIVFPILILRKLNSISDLLAQVLYPQDDESPGRNV
jgi:hypothetical protein